MSTIHATATGSEVHLDVRWTPANAAARIAINVGTPNADDVGCVAWQQDDNSTWRAIATGTGASKWVRVGALTVQTKTANFTAAPFVIYSIGTLTAAITATLPATPSTGDQVWISAGSNAHIWNVTISGNGNNIIGSSTHTLDVPYDSVVLVYDGTEWRIW